MTYKSRLLTSKFSLATLLLLVTAFSVTFAYLRWRILLQSEAKAVIFQNGGVLETKMYYELGLMHGQEFDDGVKEIQRLGFLREFLDYPVELKINNHCTPEQMYQSLDAARKLGSIQWVIIHNSRFSDDHAGVLARFHSLDSVTIRSESLTDDGAIALVHCRSLSSIDLTGCGGVTARTVDAIVPLRSRLRRVQIENTGIDEKSKARIDW